MLVKFALPRLRELTMQFFIENGLKKFDRLADTYPNLTVLKFEGNFTYEIFHLIMKRFKNLRELEAGDEYNEFEGANDVTGNEAIIYSDGLVNKKMKKLAIRHRFPTSLKLMNMLVHNFPNCVDMIVYMTSN